MTTSQKSTIQSRSSNSTTVLRILIVLASLLGILNAILVSLWGAKVYCGPRVMDVVTTTPTVVQSERRRPLWLLKLKRRRKKQKQQHELQPQQKKQDVEASLFCQYSWNVLDKLPFYLVVVDEVTPSASTTMGTEVCKHDNKRKNPLRRIISFLFQRNKPKSTTSSSTTTTTTTTMKDYPELAVAYSKDFTTTRWEEKLIHQLAHEFRQRMKQNETTTTTTTQQHSTSAAAAATLSLEERLNSVSWGGASASTSTLTKWWGPGHDGVTLLASYLRIMNWPEDLTTKFPFKLCSRGCPATFALEHTLQWRESYKPWLMSPGAIHENRNGIIYMRGYSWSSSPSPPTTTHRTNNHNSHRHHSGGHAMVWIHAGAHTGVTDPPLYFRAVLNTLELAVADTLRRSHQRVGKFNVVIDAHGANFQHLPAIGDAKKAITMLQDHFPNRLGIVILANFSKVAEFILTMVKPLITKEVREKILILPKDATKRQEILEQIVEKQFIPISLGGQDAYVFNVKEYYRDLGVQQFTDEEAKAYIQEIPHHA